MQSRRGRVLYIVLHGNRALCCHKDGLLYFDPDIMLFESLGEAKRAINDSVEDRLEARRNFPHCVTSGLEDIRQYKIVHARLWRNQK